MNIITLDLTTAKTRDDIHDIMTSSFCLPDYYGRNLDALYDIISTSYIRQRVQLNLVGFNTLPEDLQKYGEKIQDIFTKVSSDTYRISDCSIFMVNKIS